MKNLTLVAFCTVVALLAGCAAKQQSNFYTLSPTATPAASAVSCFVAVGPVSVPAVVDRPQMVFRTSPNQVSIDEFNRWAEPLKSDIARVVADNLTNILGTPTVTVFPQATSADASYRVLIDVLRFDSALGKHADMDAVWTVRSKKDNQVRTGRTTLQEPVKGGADDYGSLVAAHSIGLGRLSTEIASAIAEMDANMKQ
ncbi:MAG: membrane integrity-associated transporter subunit PqiC [Syntrophobacteraceae bacterium]